jgi:hypothetical protein
VAGGRRQEQAADGRRQAAGGRSCEEMRRSVATGENNVSTCRLLLPSAPADCHLPSAACPCRLLLPTATCRLPTDYGFYSNR